jgi:hypothetical protein
LLLRKALRETAHLWEPLKRAYAWVHAAAAILDNATQLTALQVRSRMAGLLGAMQRWQSVTGELQTATAHFLKVTRSYWSGLFHCYAVPNLPRTNNDLEHLFGRYRHLERRITGRKVVARSFVLRGAVRLVAALSSQTRTFSGHELVPHDLAQWRNLRRRLDQRCEQQRRQCRFRKNPDAYLASLEDSLVKLILPS